MLMLVLTYFKIQENETNKKKSHKFRCKKIVVFLWKNLKINTKNQSGLSLAIEVFRFLFASIATLKFTRFSQLNVTRTLKVLLYEK